MTLLIWFKLSSKYSRIMLMVQEREGNERACYQHVSESQVKTMVVSNFFVQWPLTKTLNRRLLTAETKLPCFRQVLNLGDFFFILANSFTWLFLITLTDDKGKISVWEEILCSWRFSKVLPHSIIEKGFYPKYNIVK